MKFVKALVIMLSVTASPAFAWDCKIWSQSTYPNMECYVQPVKVNKQHQYQHQNQTQQQNQTQAQLQSVDNSGNAVGNSEVSVNQEYKAAKIPVSTAYAASLTSGLDTCLGSASGGVQTAPVGVSFGKTLKDDNCIFIKKAHLMAEPISRLECFYIRSKDKEIDQAYKDAGIDCPPSEPQNLTAPAPVDTVTHEELKDHENRIVTRMLQK